MFIDDATALVLVCYMILVTIILAVVFIKTPAGSFLWAMMKRRKIMIHPTEDRYLNLRVVKPGPLAHIKGRGYYSIYPEDVYTEPKSKVSMAIVYGNTGITLDPKMVGIADRLKEIGFKNWKQLATYCEELAKKGQDMLIPILGETINASKAVDYFNTNNRSDLTEAEIQRRTAAMQAQMKKDKKDLMLYAIVAVVLFIGGAIAWQILGDAGSGAAGAQAVQSAAQVITNPAVTGAGVTVGP